MTPDEATKSPESGSPATRFLNARGGRELAGLVAGLAICAGIPPWGWWPLPILGIAIWVGLLGPIDKVSPGLGRRFLICWAVGLTWFGPSNLWMWGLTAPGYVFGTIFGWGLMVGAIGLLVPANRRRFVALPAAIVLYEWFHSEAPFGGVPLSMVSMSQARGPMLQAARLGGGLLVTGMVAALGVAVYLVAVERRWKGPVAVLAAIAVLIGGGWAATGLVHPLDSTQPTLRVAAVQGGGPQGTTFSYEEIPKVFERHMKATRSITDPVDLVIWPENAINIEGRFAEHPWKDEMAEEARRLNAPILAGVVEDHPTDPTKFLNYVVVVNPDGSLGDRYDKERRVPFGEYVPLRSIFEPLAKNSLPQRDAVVGVGSAAVDTGAVASGEPASTSVKAAVAISWEIFFPRRVREGVRDGGSVVLNPTNGSSYWLTQVQTQQLATSAFRAVESGRWTVQIAPTGFSAVFNDQGKLLKRSDISEPKVIIADVPLLRGTTPAQRFGELPAVLLALLALTPVAVDFIRDRRGDHLTVEARRNEA